MRSPFELLIVCKGEPAQAHKYPALLELFSSMFSNLKNIKRTVAKLLLRIVEGMFVGRVA